MTTTTASVLDTARTYWEAGLTPMPRVTGHVEPSYVAETGTIDAVRWGEYKSKQPDWATVARWFAHSDLATVGLLLLTGNHAHPRAEDAAFLQILDIETPDLVAALQEALHFLGHSAILHRCVIERTPSGGGHVGFLCRSITDKHKLPLARRVDHTLLIELLQHQPCTVAPTMTIRCKPVQPAGVGYTLLHGRWDQHRRSAPRNARSSSMWPAPSMKCLRKWRMNRRDVRQTARARATSSTAQPTLTGGKGFVANFHLRPFAV